MNFLVVDDHPMIRKGLERTLSTEFPEASFRFACTPDEALKSLLDGKVNLVILDLNLPGSDGLELLREIKEHDPQIRVLVHTMYAEEQFGVRALRAGADGYLTKDKPVEDLLQAVRLLRGGRRFVSPILAERLIAALGNKREGTDLSTELSDREHQIMRMIVAGKAPKEIGAELGISSKTVSTYRTRLLDKLDLHSTAELVRFALENKLA
jgi:two-component system, NarL family, invasion response regulator UvrY